MTTPYPVPKAVPLAQGETAVRVVKPHDPRKTVVSAEEVEKNYLAIVSEPSSSLQEEVEVLSRAHDVLHEALN